MKRCVSFAEPSSDLHGIAEHSFRNVGVDTSAPMACYIWNITDPNILISRILIS